MTFNYSLFPLNGTDRKSLYLRLPHTLCFKCSAMLSSVWNMTHSAKNWTPISQKSRCCYKSGVDQGWRTEGSDNSLNLILTIINLSFLTPTLIFPLCQMFLDCLLIGYSRRRANLPFIWWFVKKIFPYKKS